MFTIPVQNTPQRFEIELAGVTYTLENRFNSVAGYWELEVADAAGVPIVTALPLLAGVNLVEGYPGLPTGVLAIITDGDETADPTLTSLGDDSKLYYLPP